MCICFGCMTITSFRQKKKKLYGCAKSVAMEFLVGGEKLRKINRKKIRNSHKVCTFAYPIFYKCEQFNSSIKQQTNHRTLKKKHIQLKHNSGLQRNLCKLKMVLLLLLLFRIWIHYRSRDMRFTVHFKIITSAIILYLCVRFRFFYC